MNNFVLYFLNLLNILFDLFFARTRKKLPENWEKKNLAIFTPLFCLEKRYDVIFMCGLDNCVVVWIIVTPIRCSRWP